MVQASSSPGLGGALGVLRERNYRWFFLGQCASLLGDGMAPPALTFAVLAMTGSATDLGFTLTTQIACQMLFTVVGGVIADRVPRHRLMLACDLIRTLSQGLMAVLLVTHTAHIWHLLVLQAVSGLAAALFTPAIAGVVQTTTRPDQRQAANALRVLALSTALVIGPTVAGLLAITAGPGWAISLDAATFAISAGCLSRLRLTAAIRTARFVADLIEGWHEFRSRRWVWSVISAASLNNLLYGAFLVLGPVICVRSYGGAGAWALISAMFGVGCLAGGTVALYVRPRYPLRAGVLMMVLFASPALALAANLGAGPVAAAACGGGLVMMVFNTLWETALQQHIPPATLSRVSAYEWAGAISGQPIGLAIVASIAAHAGTRTTLWAAGGLQVLVVLAPLLAPEVRKIRDVPEADTCPDRGLAPPSVRPPARRD